MPDLLQDFFIFYHGINAFCILGCIQGFIKNGLDIVVQGIIIKIHGPHIDIR